MQKTIVLVAVLLSIMISFLSTKALGHGLGTVLTKELSEGTTLEFEYEAIEIVESRPVLLEYRVKKNDSYQDVDYSFIRIADESGVVFLSANITPETLTPSIARLNASFPRSGKYEVHLRIKLASEEEPLRSSIELSVRPESSFVEKNWKLILASLAPGLIMGIAAGVLWQKNIKK